MPVRPLLPVLAVLLISTGARADNCDLLKTQIETRIRGGGIGNPGLVVADNAAVVAGRVVGSCAMGSRKIVQTQQLSETTPASVTAGTAARPQTVAATTSSTTAASAPARRKDDILTECKDGSMSVGGRCGR